MDAQGNLPGGEAFEVGQLESLSLLLVELGEGLEGEAPVGRTLQLIVGCLAELRRTEARLLLTKAELIGPQAIERAAAKPDQQPRPHAPPLARVGPSAAPSFEEHVVNQVFGGRRIDRDPPADREQHGRVAMVELRERGDPARDRVGEQLVIQELALLTHSPSPEDGT